VLKTRRKKSHGPGSEVRNTPACEKLAVHHGGRGHAGAWDRRDYRNLQRDDVVLAIAGGILGTLIALWGSDVIQTVVPRISPSPQNDYAQLSEFATPELDGTVLLFSLLISVGTGVAFGLIPAIQASKPDLVTGLKEGNVIGTSKRNLTTLSGLIVTEVALSVLLLMGLVCFCAASAACSQSRRVLMRPMS